MIKCSGKGKSNERNPRMPKFDTYLVEIDLSGPDGNALMILGRAMNALRDAGATSEQVAAYRDEATSGDYNNLISVTHNWVHLEADYYSEDDEALVNHDGILEA